MIWVGTKQMASTLLFFMGYYIQSHATVHIIGMSFIHTFCLLLSVVIWVGTKQMASTLSFFMGDFIERKSTGKM